MKDSIIIPKNVTASQLRKALFLFKVILFVDRALLNTKYILSGIPQLISMWHNPFVDRRRTNMFYYPERRRKGLIRQRLIVLENYFNRKVLELMEMFELRIEP